VSDEPEENEKLQESGIRIKVMGEQRRRKENWLEHGTGNEHHTPTLWSWPNVFVLFLASHTKAL